MKFESKKQLFVQIFSLSGIWLIGMVLPFVFSILSGVQLNFEDNNLFFICYYFFLISILFFFFPKTTKTIYFNNQISSFAYVTATLGLCFFCYGFLFKYLDPTGESVRVFGISGKGNFLLGSKDYFMVKLLEIIFQQTLIVGLVLSLASYFKRVSRISAVYALVFGVSHLYLIMLFSWQVTLIFFLFSCLSAILFPILILKTKSGFIYTFIIHLLFYVFLNLSLITYSVLM